MLETVGGSDTGAEAGGQPLMGAEMPPGKKTGNRAMDEHRFAYLAKGR